VAPRKVPLVAGEIYHVFNRGVEHRPIFLTKRDYRRFLKTINYYRFVSTPLRLFRFYQLSAERQKEILDSLVRANRKHIGIIAFCLIPNHFHLLLKQLSESGISLFLSQLQNSYTKFFNLKYNRVGPLFQGQFKAVRIETDSQLAHVSRYLHLNPYSSFVIKDREELEAYTWSSLNDYLGFEPQNPFIENKVIMGLFGSTENYRNFVYNNADYQRSLENIKHLLLD